MQGIKRLSHFMIFPSDQPQNMHFPKSPLVINTDLKALGPFEESGVKSALMKYNRVHEMRKTVS